LGRRRLDLGRLLFRGKLLLPRLYVAPPLFNDVCERRLLLRLRSTPPLFGNWRCGSCVRVPAALRSPPTWVLVCNTLSTKAAPPNPSVGASTRTHSTLLTLSSSLRVKGLTRGWYGWWTKPYKLAPPLLNWQCGTKHVHLRSWATHGPSNLGQV
jgi:hypothetical protein